jgi:hypothetical protein
MALCEDAYLGGALAGKQKVFYCLGQNPAAGKCLHYSIWIICSEFLRIARKSQPHPIGCAQLTECHKWMHGHWVRNAKCITSTRASIITLLTQWVSEIVLHHVHWTSHPHPDNNRIHDQLYLLCHHKGPVNSHWCRVRVGWICSTRTSYCVFDIWECMLQNTINVLLCTRTTWRVAIHEQCLACEQE